MSIKLLLRQTRECLMQKDYVAALDVVGRLLDLEPHSINALLYKASACQSLELYAESERTLLTTVSVQEDSLLAWQGLEKLYEKTQNYEKRANALSRLITLYAQAKDAAKLLESIQRLISVYLDSADINNWAETMLLLLPTCQYYGLLVSATNASSLPSPVEIWQRIILTQEQSDREKTAKEIELRRRRLNAGTLKQVKKQVEKEIILSSKLGKSYKELINVSNDSSDIDIPELNTRYINYLIQRLEHLTDPSDEISNTVQDTRKELATVCNDAVIHRQPIVAAYQFIIDTIDCSKPDGYPETLLQDAIHLLSGDFAVAIQSFLSWKKKDLSTTEAVNFLNIPVLNESLFVQHALIYMYTELKGYESIISIGENAISVLTRYRQMYDCVLDAVERSIKLSMAESYQLRGDTFTGDALALFRDVAQQDRTNTRAIQGLADVFIDLKKYGEAKKCAAKVLALNSESYAAHVTFGWAAFHESEWKEAEFHIRSAITAVTTLVPHQPSLQHLLAVYYYKLGRVLWVSQDVQTQKDKTAAFDAFIQAAQMDQQFADPFTYLGHFYRVSGNQTRAFKCYLKSYNLNPQDPEDSAIYLCQYYIERGEEALAVNVLRVITGYSNRKKWAWKMLGYAEHVAADYMAAVTCFQTAVRIDSSDKQVWIGLGDGYLALGKYTACLKAFQRALELDPQCSVAASQRAYVQLKLGLFNECITNLNTLLAELNPDSDLAIYIVATKYLSDAYLAYAKDCFLSTRYAACGEYLCCGVSAIWDVIQLRPAAMCLWRQLGELLWFYTRILSQTCQFNRQDILTQIQRHDGATSILHDTQPIESKEKHVDLEWLLVASAQAISVALSLHPIPYLWCIRHAIKSNAINDAQLWNGMGVIAMFANEPGLSQHCLIKAVQLDTRDAVAWTNLGYLYFTLHDYDLANQAFKSAQTTDPDYAQAWLGQALVADHWSSSEALNLFIHSYDLSQGSEMEINFLFASKVFAVTLVKQQPEKVQDPRVAIQCEFAMRKYIEMHPDDIAAWNTHGLLLEQAGQYAEARTCFETSLRLLRHGSAIATSENDASRINANLARILCSMSLFTESARIYQDVTQPSLYCKLGEGITLFFDHRLEDSLLCFQDALSIVKGESKILQNDVGILLAQVLFALNGPMHIELARDQLLQCATRLPTELYPFAYLCALGVVTDDLTLVSTALQEFLHATPHRLVTYDQSMHGPYLLSSFAQLQGSNITGKRFLLKAIHRTPSSAQAWIDTAHYLMRHESHLVLAIASTTAVAHALSMTSVNISLLGESTTLQAVGALTIDAKDPTAKRRAQRCFRMSPCSYIARSVFACSLLNSPEVLQLAGHHLYVLANEEKDSPLKNSFYQMLLATAKMRICMYTPSLNPTVLPEAVRLCETVIIDCSDENRIVKAHALCILGQVLWVNGDLNDAILAFKNAIESNPAVSASWIDLASLYFTLGDTTTAETTLTTFAQVGENLNSPVMQLLAAMQLLQQRTTIAQTRRTPLPHDAIEAVIFHTQTFAPAFSRFETVARAFQAIHSLHSKQEQRAIKTLNKQLHDNFNLDHSEYPWLHYLLSYAYYRQNKPALALESINKERTIFTFVTEWRTMLQSLVHSVNDYTQ